MESKFDFILFENYHIAVNHKYDVVLIARLLQHAGMKVGIVDIYHEDNINEISGIPVIHLKCVDKIPNDYWMLHPKNKLHSLLCLIRFLYQQHFYMRKVKQEIENLADYFYCGSYHTAMPFIFFYSKKECYYWGLRSSRMTDFWSHFKQNPLLAFRMLMLRSAFKRNPSQKLFVSNAIIKTEFEKLGIPNNRMVIREERCLESSDGPHYEALEKQCTFLAIGKLRPDKRVEMTIEAFQQISKKSDVKLFLIGAAHPKYEQMLQSMYISDNAILRDNSYLDYCKFNDYIRRSHFVVFADKQQLSSVTNGTMLEALINYRPIIAPNYDPYKFYVNKYGIGLLYDPMEAGDLERVLVRAVQLGCSFFYENIDRYVKSISFDRVSSDLYNAIIGH